MQGMSKGKIKFLKVGTWIIQQKMGCCGTVGSEEYGTVTVQQAQSLQV